MTRTSQFLRGGEATGVRQQHDVMVDLSAHFNNDAFSYAGRTSRGGFNVWRNTFPAEVMPASNSTFVVRGVPFRFPPKEDGCLNNVVCAGQLLEVGSARYDWLYVLAASERRAEEWIYLHYTNGTVDPEWLRVSDFWPESPNRFGGVMAIQYPKLHFPRHVQRDLRPIIWCQRVPVTRMEPLARIRLPHNVAIHIFAATLVAVVDPNRAERASNGDE